MSKFVIEIFFETEKGWYCIRRKKMCWEWKIWFQLERHTHSCCFFFFFVAGKPHLPLITHYKMYLIKTEHMYYIRFFWVQWSCMIEILMEIKCFYSLARSCVSILSRGKWPITELRDELFNYIYIYVFYK